MIVQELVHSMRNRRNGKGLMMIKLDIEKAYYRVRWDFLQDTLVQVGLPSEWVSLMMNFINSNNLQFEWNGRKIGSITLTRGIRQRDPLSPYLFVLCIERLNHMI